MGTARQNGHTAPLADDAELDDLEIDGEIEQRAWTAALLDHYVARLREEQPLDQLVSDQLQAVAGALVDLYEAIRLPPPRWALRISELHEHD